MDERCEILIEKIYRELEGELSRRGISLEAVDDYFFDYERDELEDILEDITLNYLNRRKVWERRIIEDNLGAEETYEDEGLEGGSENPNGDKVLKDTKAPFKDPRYDEEGYDKDGYDILGWSKSGYHKTTQTRYNIGGYDREGYNALNWSKSGTHKITKTEYDENGYNERGYDIYGWNKEGYNEKTNSLYNEEGYDRSGNRKPIWERVKSSLFPTKN